MIISEDEFQQWVKTKTFYKQTWANLKRVVQPCECGCSTLRLKDTVIKGKRAVAVSCPKCKKVGPISEYDILLKYIHDFDSSKYILVDGNKFSSTKEAIVEKAISLWNND